MSGKSEHVREGVRVWQIEREKKRDRQRFWVWNSWINVGHWTSNKLQSNYTCKRLCKNYLRIREQHYQYGSFQSKLKSVGSLSPSIWLTITVRSHLHDIPSQKRELWLFHSFIYSLCLPDLLACSVARSQTHLCPMHSLIFSLRSHYMYDTFFSLELIHLARGWHFIWAKRTHLLCVRFFF